MSRGNKGSIRILALGDSYTIGEGLPLPNGWPAQLKAALQREGYTLEDPTIIAQTGWTTRDLLAAIEDANPQGPFNLVTLLIGVNNQYQGGDIETYRMEFHALSGLAANFAEGSHSKVLVLSIPDWGGTPFNKDRDPTQISAEIDRFNAINKKESQDAGRPYIDITPLTRQETDNPMMLVADSLHPSATMYALWVEMMLPTVLRILQSE